MTTKTANSKNHETSDAKPAKSGEAHPEHVDHAAHPGGANPPHNAPHSHKHHEPKHAAAAPQPAQEPDASSICEEELKARQSDMSAITEQMVRLQADFDNLRRRTQKEKGETYRRALDEIALEILPVLDNMERALAADAASKEPRASNAMLDGMKLVAGQLSGILVRFGISPFETVGKPFDPGLHEAISVVESAEVPPNCVVTQTRKGYMAGDRLLRAAQVVVSQQPAADQDQPDTEKK